MADGRFRAFAKEITMEPAQPMQQPPQQPQEQGAPPEQPGNVSPEQQEAYDIFVGQGTKLAASVAEEIESEADPKMIADAMLHIINTVESEGEQNGVQFDVVAKLHGSLNILTNLLDMSGVEMPEEQLKETVGYLVGKYLEGSIQSGKMSQEEVVQLSEQAQQPGEQGLLGKPPAGQIQ
jgi:hypothetical protein